MNASLAVASSAAASDWAIDLADVAKTYKGKIEALKGIQMRVHHGEVFGLLGPNGAGKSTLVKILMTVIRPSRCKGTMLGQPVGSQRVLRRIGYLPEHHRFPPYLTGAQVLDFYAALTEVPKATRKARIPELLELVGMQDWGDVKVSRYSKGMRQRVGIAQALMNDPDIVLLDEPTDGVDPVGRRDIREILAELKRRGKTVFLNSHLLSELEMVCDRVAILVHGQVATQGTIDELTAGKERYEIELDAPAKLKAALPGLVRFDEAEDTGAAEHTPDGRDTHPTEHTGGRDTHPTEHTGGRDTHPTEHTGGRDARPTGKLATGEWVEIDQAMLRVGTTDAATIQPIIDSLRAHGAVIRSIRQCRPSLEDLFMAAVDEQGEGVGSSQAGSTKPTHAKGGAA